MKAVLPALASALLAGGAAMGGDVFLSSPPFDITVTLEFTDPADPYASQGYIESYRSVSMFSHVTFGPSFSPDFPAMFSTGYGGASMPSLQVPGTGVIESFTLQPAWESEDPIEGRVTHGPEMFEPWLTVVTLDMAMEMQGGGDGGDMPLVPLVPTLWVQFDESFSLDEPELAWEYPDFAANYVVGSVAVFPLPLSVLGEGQCLEITQPYENGTASGTWTIRLETEQ